MYKFEAQIPSEEFCDSVESFLLENEFINWGVESNKVTGQCFLCGYLDSTEKGESEFSKIKNAFPGLIGKKVRKYKQVDWSQKYKKFIKPWQCENLFWIPEHLRGQVSMPEGSIPVYIEPGMAFGTGVHETTRLCGRALMMFKNMYEKNNDLIVKTCMDVGCGSGILGITALKVGFVHSTMIDIDADAVRIAGQNALLNGIFPDQMTLVTGDIKSNLLGRQADLVVANILSNVLIENADLLISCVKPDGILCLSGVLRKEKEEVRAIFREKTEKKWNAVLDNSIDDGEWSALVYFAL